MLDTVAPCIIGLFLGVLYGFLFIRNSENTPSLSQYPLLTFFSSIRFFLIRIGIIGILWRTLLHSSSLMIILATASFLLGFWTIVISKKVRHHEQP